MHGDFGKGDDATYYLGDIQARTPNYQLMFELLFEGVMSIKMKSKNY